MRARCVLAVSVALALQLLAVSADAKEVNQAENFAAYQKLVGPASHVTVGSGAPQPTRPLLARWGSETRAFSTQRNLRRPSSGLVARRPAPTRTSSSSMRCARRRRAPEGHHNAA
jgi:hypothetical protein